MNVAAHIYWLAKMAFSMAAYFWYISLPLLVACIVVSLHMKTRVDIDRRGIRQRVWAMFAFPIIILAFGTFNRGGHSFLAGGFVDATFGLLLALCAYFLFTLRGSRIYFVAYSLTALWFAACTSYAAGASIMNSWL
jgi:hypothetical protein